MQTLSAMIAMADAAGAIDFYQQAFGATELFRLVDPGDGKVGHAELRLGDALLMLAGEYEGFNQTPAQLGGSTVRFHLAVDDCDAAIDRAVAAGAKLVRPAETQFYGWRSGTVEDPYGYQWMITTEVERVDPDEMQRRWNAAAAG